MPKFFKVGFNNRIYASLPEAIQAAANTLSVNTPCIANKTWKGWQVSTVTRNGNLRRRTITEVQPCSKPDKKATVVYDTTLLAEVGAGAVEGE